MSRTTRNLRVCLDFTIQLPRGVSSLPFGDEDGAGTIHRVLTAGWKGALAELTPGTLQDGDTVLMLPGGKMHVSLDYRPEKTKTRTHGRLSTQKKPPAT